MTTVKHYAMRRDVLRAVQWSGVMTPDVQDLIKGHHVEFDEDQQLQLGGGRCVRVGEWLCSRSGEDLFKVSDDVFRKTYEEVDVGARPTADEHEQAGREFVQQLDALLADGLRLSREAHPEVFQRRDQLTRTLRRLFEDHAWVVAQRELARIRNKIDKELK
jgi:hypothetical protein